MIQTGQAKLEKLLNEPGFPMVGPITARDTGPVRKHIAINKISETVGGGGEGGGGCNGGEEERGKAEEVISIR